MRRRIAAAAAVLALALALTATACGGKKSAKVNRPAVESQEQQFQAPNEGDPIAIFHTSKGEIRAVLYPDDAPMAVENFTGLVEQGYYNGLTFHRAVYGALVQGGDGTGTGLAAPPSGGTIPSPWSLRTGCTTTLGPCAWPTARRMPPRTCPSSTLCRRCPGWTGACRARWKRPGGAAGGH